MKARCIAAVGAALGRPLTAGETRDIENRMRDAMKSEARRDPVAWQQLPLADQLISAARVASQQIVDEAKLKQARVGLQIKAWDAIENFANDQVAKGVDETRLDALDRLLASKNDGKDNTWNVESESRGIVATSMGKLVAAWEAISPKFLGILANDKMEEAFILEAHGFDTGIAEIKQAVKSWTEETDLLRERFNTSGGNVGKLDNWGMPHSWSQHIAVKVGRDKWVSDFMKFVDRSVYLHEDGTAYTDAEMQAFLEKAWLTVATGGANKVKPEPMPGGAIKANRNSQERQIHFKDGFSALDAYKTYTEGNLFQTISGHITRMARDISVIERFGPNSDHAFEALINKFSPEAHQTAALTGDPKAATHIDSKVEGLTTLYNYLSGNNPPPVDSWLGRAGADIRAVLSAAKLGSATITSIADEGTLYLTAHVNKLPLIKLFLNELKALSPLHHEEKALAMRAGLMVKTMMSDMNRFGADAKGERWSQKMSSVFMRASFLERLTETRRRAFSVTMMDALGNLTRRLPDVSRLSADDHGFLAGKGIDDATWQIWRAATPEDWGGNHTVLTPESIMRVPGFSEVEKARAASRLMGVILEEQDIAVIEPGARERADMQAGVRAGTFKGELMRSIFLFKSFPHAMFSRHIKRAMGAYGSWSGSAGYLAALVAMQTVMGAVALEINDVLSGKDPRNLNPAEKFGMQNWLAAFLKGGALGYYGDFLFDLNNTDGRTFAESVTGPVLGTVAGFDALTRGNAIQYLRGQETHAGAELARFLRGITPGSNLWYAKAALDHLIFQNMQEYFSPGYLADMRAKAQEKAGTTYWWKPGRPIDEARAPNIANAVGVKQ